MASVAAPAAALINVNPRDLLFSRTPLRVPERGWMAG